MPGPSSSLTSSTSFPDELTSSRRQRGSPTIGSFPSSPTSTSSSPSQAVHRPARPSISLPSALSNSFAPSSPADSLTITSFPRFSSWRTGSGPSSPKVKQAHARSWTLSSLLDYEEKDVKREDDRGGGMKRGLTGSLSSSLNLNLLAGRGGKKGRKRSALVLSFLAASLLLAAYGMLHSSGSTRGLEESSREGKGAGLSSWFSRGRERTGTALPNKGEPDLQHADDKDAIKPLSIDQVLATSRPEIFLPPLDTPTPPPIAPPRSLSSLPRRTPARIVLPIYSLPLPDNFHTTLSILRELTSFSVLLAFPEAVRSSIETAFLGISSAPDFVSWDALPGPHEEDDNGDFLDRCLLTTLLDSNDSNDLSLSAFSSYLFLPPLASLPPPFQLKADLFPLLSYPEPSLSSHYTLSLVGARLSSASLLLIVSPEEPTPAAFGVPPLLVSRQTLRSSIIGLRKELPVWAGLAERINVLNQARPLGRGGAVDIAAWVAEGKGQGELGLGREVSRHSELEAESRLKAQLGYTILDTSSSADQVNVTRRHRALYHSLSTPKTDLGSISLVIPSVSILTNLSPLACTVLGRGHNLRVHLSHPSTLVERQLLRKRSPCELAFDVRLKGRSYEEWVDGTEGEGSQVIIVVDGESGWEKSWIGKGSKGNEEKEPAVVIEIPRSEAEMESAGKIWDWVGTLGITALRHWHTPRIDLSVVTNDRTASLSRLLTSLTSAHYFSPLPSSSQPFPSFHTPVHLSLSLERTTTPQTHALLSSFSWPHGPLTARHRVVQGGLLPAIVESWYPNPSFPHDSFGILLEDDVEVSPMFFGWAKWAILKYRYEERARERSGRMFGVSLYGQRNVELRMEGRRPFDPREILEGVHGVERESPYLSQVPCSWGGVYFPEIWREFHAYVSDRVTPPPSAPLKPTSPLVPSIRSNRWPRSWKKYFIELVHLKGYAGMLYPNYDDFLSLSTNHLEPGQHVKIPVVPTSLAPVDPNTPNDLTSPPPSRLSPEDQASAEAAYASAIFELEKHAKKKAMFTVPLIPASTSLLSMGLPPFPEGLPAFENLPILDFWGFPRSAESLVEAGRETYTNVVLQGCVEVPEGEDGKGWKRLKDVAVLDYDGANILCPGKPVDLSEAGSGGKGKKKKTGKPVGSVAMGWLASWLGESTVGKDNP